MLTFRLGWIRTVFPFGFIVAPFCTKLGSYPVIMVEHSEKRDQSASTQKTTTKK